MIMKKCKVLFLCNGNSARSQMAEGILRWHNGEQFEVFSAGVEPKGINPLTIEVMNELGYDMSEHRSKFLSEFAGVSDFNYIITMCSEAEQNCPFFPGKGIRLHWPFDDPAAAAGTKEEKLNKFRQVRDQIDCKMLDWMTKIGYLATA